MPELRNATCSTSDDQSHMDRHTLDRYILGFISNTEDLVRIHPRQTADVVRRSLGRTSRNQPEALLRNVP